MALYETFQICHFHSVNMPSITSEVAQNSKLALETMPILNSARAHWQSWKMSNLLHGPISTNQILPREKRVNRDIFGTSNLQNRTYGVSCDE